MIGCSDDNAAALTRWMNCYDPQGSRQPDGSCNCSSGFIGNNCQYAAANAVDCTNYSRPSSPSSGFYICVAGLSGPFCDKTAFAAEEEAAHSMYYYIAGGTIVGLVILLLYRAKTKLMFALLVIFRIVDFMSDWASWALALQSEAFAEGVVNSVELAGWVDPVAVADGALAFNIIATLIWVPDMVLHLQGEPAAGCRQMLTGLIIVFEDIPQLVFACIYFIAILSTEQYGVDGDPCVYAGRRPIDPVIIVSLAGSAFGLFFNFRQCLCPRCCGGESYDLSG